VYSPELLDHFQNPRNAGELPPPARTVEVSNPVCGDILRLSVLWDGDRVGQAGYRARGCTAAIAAGSALTELIDGRTRAELASFRKSEIEAALGGLPPESGHVASLCMEAVRAVLK
jgi:nitrogen fixation NifU-like protein